MFTRIQKQEISRNLNDTMVKPMLLRFRALRLILPLAFVLVAATARGSRHHLPCSN